MGYLPLFSSDGTTINLPQPTQSSGPVITDQIKAKTLNIDVLDASGNHIFQFDNGDQAFFIKDTSGTTYTYLGTNFIGFSNPSGTFNLDMSPSWSGGGTLYLPPNNGSAGQFLQTSGGAVATSSWVTIPPTNPAGSNTQIQFNNSGAFGGSSNLVWDNTNNRVGISSPAAPTEALEIGASGSIKLTTPDGSSNVTGGHILVTTGTISGVSDANGGGLTLTTGTAAGYGRGGSILLSTGNCHNPVGGSITLTTGATNGATPIPGNLILTCGDQDIDATVGGNITLTSGNTGAGAPSQGGSIFLTSGTTNGTATGGNITLTSSQAANGGNITLTGTGASHGTITAGGNMAIDGTTLKVDSVNHRVGIGNASPGSLLDVNGAVNIGGTTAGSLTVTGPSAGSGGSITVTGNTNGGGGQLTVTNGVTSSGSGQLTLTNSAGTTNAGASLVLTTTVNTNGQNPPGGSITLTASRGSSFTTGAAGGGITLTTSGSSFNSGITTGTGGSILLTSGGIDNSSTGATGNGGGLTLTTGDATNSGNGLVTTGNGGSILLTSGNSHGGACGTGGGITLSSGTSGTNGTAVTNALSAAGGTITLTSGTPTLGIHSNTSGPGGSLILTSGNAGDAQVAGTSGAGGSITLTSGTATNNGAGGNITLTAGTATNGGSIIMTGTGANGTPGAPAKGNIYANNGNFSNVYTTGNIGVANSSPAATLDVNGSVAFNLVTVSSTTYSVLTTEYTILGNAASNNIAITLPSVSTNIHRVINFKKTDSSANTVTINRNSADTIDGQTSVVLTTQYQSITLQSDGTNWWIL